MKLKRHYHTRLREISSKRAENFNLQKIPIQKI